MQQDSILSHIHSPEDLKKLKDKQLPALCEEIREVLIQTVSHTGGHLSSNLGVVELTVALHRVMDCPTDQIVWDVGHQCYTHKLLTGRFRQFDTLRKMDGLSGFPCPSESPYDAFVAGHSSTAVSAANGIAKAKALLGQEGYTIAVLGDGALTGGLAYEGLTNAGRSHDKLIVILNDNRMSINKNVGFVARHLATLRSQNHYIRIKHGIANFIRYIPLIGKPFYRLLLRAKLNLKYAMYDSSTLFEDMGFYYFGPIDGHNLHDLMQALRAAKTVGKPVLLHVDTIKGRGYTHAMREPDTYHGVAGFDVESGQTPPSAPSYSSVFGKALTNMATKDERICAVTASMQSGTGLNGFAQAFPKRCFDVGIAEEHAVTFSSGMAAGGLLPVFAVYSTFLQRSYDQILNDTAISGNHIVLAIDRAGIVPEDGITHQGIFDVAFLHTIPGVTIFSPSCFKELRHCLRKAVYETEGIAAVRYPRGGELPLGGYQPDEGAYVFREEPESDTLLVTYGREFAHVLQAARELGKTETPVSVLKLLQIRPLEEDCIIGALKYRRILFFEEGTTHGGVAEAFGCRLLTHGYTGRYEIHAIDNFIPTCTVEQGLALTGLDAEGVRRAVLSVPDGEAAP